MIDLLAVTGYILWFCAALAVTFVGPVFAAFLLDDRPSPAHEGVQFLAACAAFALGVFLFVAWYATGETLWWTTESPEYCQ